MVGVVCGSGFGCVESVKLKRIRRLEYGTACLIDCGTINHRAGREREKTRKKGKAGITTLSLPCLTRPDGFNAQGEDGLLH